MKPGTGITLREIAERLEGELAGDHGNIVISEPASLREAVPGNISFLAHRRYLKDLQETRASAVVLPKGVSFDRLPSIRVDDPHFAFAQLLHLFYDLPYQSKGVDERAIVGRGVQIGRDVTIYPYVYIEEGASIGDQVMIYPGTFVGKGSLIGDHSIIYPNVTIREGCRIGRRVIIHSGAVIGSDGFGFVPYKGEHHKIPQMGGVIIGDDVEIGANTTIDRATIGNTVIKRGTKIDNLVQIAHNVSVGEDCVFAAQSGIAGSTQIGSHVTMAGQAGVTGHIRIGDQVTVAGQAGVTKDVKEGQTVAGMPALPHREWLKAMAVFEDLPELKKKLSELGNRIEEIERIVGDKKGGDGYGHKRDSKDPSP
ncbi:MAG: UDP-3-O-(3-hydroxymyristoyl)glucosamine N-acyltransferase [Nitrospirae bacterium]|nr:UDP-3-O-(3-hydroxymyristoyl)glucosamine N-acyltransferase [Nitrospirota bacterium]MBI5096269.1 UDP-3-O-(3-hydroxymyristoyl)glucosamine N-acyltransferase [Nitrospirota bacterium]